MSQSIQEYLAARITQAATDLVTAYERLPEDKRAWAPAETSRSAVDQIAECALLNGMTDTILTEHQFVGGGMEEYFKLKADTVKLSYDALKQMLVSNAAKVAATVKALPDADLAISVQMPWGAMTLEQMISYPAWNMGYHEAQINYIASILGCLE